MEMKQAVGQSQQRVGSFSVMDTCINKYTFITMQIGEHTPTQMPKPFQLIVRN